MSFSRAGARQPLLLCPCRGDGGEGGLGKDPQKTVCRAELVSFGGFALVGRSWAKQSSGQRWSWCWLHAGDVISTSVGGKTPPVGFACHIVVLQRWCEMRINSKLAGYAGCEGFGWRGDVSLTMGRGAVGFQLGRVIVCPAWLVPDTFPCC